MKAIEILKIAQHQFYSTLQAEGVTTHTFEEYWNDILQTFVDLKVCPHFISGTEGITINPSTRISCDTLRLEKRVVSKGCWLWMYVGHSGEFYLHNYKAKDAAERLILEFQDNPFITAMFIVEV